jgi:hypothetical protein
MSPNVRTADMGLAACKANYLFQLLQIWPAGNQLGARGLQYTGFKVKGLDRVLRHLTNI